MQSKYLNVGAVAARYQVSKSTVWRWLREGAIPQPVRFGPRVTRWPVHVLEAWEASQGVDK